MAHFQLSHLGPKCEHNKGSTVYSKAAHVLHAPPLVTSVAAAVSVFTTVSLVYKVAPYCPASPLTLKTITFLLCSAVSRLLALAILVLTLH